MPTFMPAPDTALPLLGGLSPRQFMRRHWQRRPLLIRAAIAPDANGVVAADGPASRIDLKLLRRLAADDDVESRLVLGPRHAPAGRSSRIDRADPATLTGRPGHASKADTAWRLQNGPFKRLPAVSSPGWSLLVQGVDLHVDAARGLIDRFRFVSDARLDDLMVSFASDGGGVGAHVDSYDVFLLQLEGRRRWSIAPPPRRRQRLGSNAAIPPRHKQRLGSNAAIAPGSDGQATSALRHLADFEPTEQWLLEPGDMLYLPPGWGHDGVADGPCLTASIGFRSPTLAQWLAAIHETLDDDGDPAMERPFRDGGAVASAHPGRIPDTLADHLLDWARHWRPRADQLERALGRLLTEPKPQVWFDADDGRADELPTLGELRVDRRSRLLCRGRYVFINGEVVEPPSAARRWLQHFADHRRLAASDLAKALRDPWLTATLSDWLAAGWIHGNT